MGQAFKPLGVNLDFWDPNSKQEPGTASASYLTNDTDEALTGKLNSTLEPRAGSGKQSQAETAFVIPALGQQKYDLELAIPPTEGEVELKASASCGKPWCPTVSRRRMMVAQSRNRKRGSTRFSSTN